jgi:hypothetical protein
MSGNGSQFKIKYLLIIGLEWNYLSSILILE